MIWSIFKALIFVALAAAVTWGVWLIIELPGEVKISLADREWPLTPIKALILFIAAMFVVWVALRLIGIVLAIFRYLSGDETALTRYFDRGRERRGFEALTQSLLSLASGDAKKAQSQAQQAEKLLDRPELTRLINAQSAEASGDIERAALYYKEMLTQDKSRFAGVLGLMRHKLEAGDTDTALKLAEKAFAISPRHTGTLDTLFKLQSQKQDWAGARSTLKAKVAAASLPRDVGKRREAILLLANARAAMENEEIEKAREASYQANRLAPDLVPAAALAAELHAKAGEGRRAVRIVKRAWSTAPHPDLAAAFAAIAPDETPAERLKRFQPLLRQALSADESRLVGAELALAAEDFPEARRALGDLAETKPTTRSLALMAAIERGQGETDAVVRGWLAKALSAPRGEAWVCSTCHHVHSTWVPICEQCGAFDTLSWQPQPAVEDAAHTAGMLPLIVGALERPEPEPEPQPETESVPETDTAESAEHEDIEDAEIAEADVVPETEAPRATPA
ncbi:heme biosynthesis HemY N-terminal domain-containing protein [Halovulum sp. GXIMD14793]